MSDTGVDDAGLPVGTEGKGRRNAWHRAIASNWAAASALERLVAVAALAGLLMAIVGAVGRLLLTDEWDITLVLLLQNAIIIIVLAALLAHRSRKQALEEALLKSESERSTNTLEAFGKAFHRMSHKTRDLLFALADSPRDLSPNDTVETLVSYCNCMGLIFKAIHRERITFHVAMKAFVSPDHVMAIARDSDTLETTGKPAYLVRDNKTAYSIRENTAFGHLLTTDNIVYANDDLLHDPYYRNRATGWQERYTATMVVPIRRSHISRRADDLFEIAGYIGVDCYLEESIPVFCDRRGRPRGYLTNILLSFADSAFGIITRARVVDAVCPRLPYRQYVIDTESFDFVLQLNEALTGKPNSPELIEMLARVAACV